MLVAGRVAQSRGAESSAADGQDLEGSLEQLETGSVYSFPVPSSGQCHYAIRRNAQGEHCAHAVDYSRPAANDGNFLWMDGVTAARRALDRVVVVMCDWYQSREVSAVSPIAREENLRAFTSWSRFAHAPVLRRVSAPAPRQLEAPRSFQSEPFLGEKVSTSKLNLAQMRRISRTRSVESNDE